MGACALVLACSWAGRRCRACCPRAPTHAVLARPRRPLAVAATAATATADLFGRWGGSAQGSRIVGCVFGVAHESPAHASAIDAPPLARAHARAGTFLDSNSTCTPCALGMYRADSDSQDACKLIPSGAAWAWARTPLSELAAAACRLPVQEHARPRLGVLTPAPRAAAHAPPTRRLPRGPHSGA